MQWVCWVCCVRLSMLSLRCVAPSDQGARRIWKCQERSLSKGNAQAERQGILLMAANRHAERDDDQPVGLTVREVARRYRVGTQKVVNWIRRGELGAINTSTSLCSRPRFVVLPDALLAFEKARAVVPKPKPARRARPRSDFIDFFPDGNCDLCGAKARQDRRGRKLCEEHARSAGWLV
jgi:hypothetical protein